MKAVDKIEEGKTKPGKLISWGERIDLLLELDTTHKNRPGIWNRFCHGAVTFFDFVPCYSFMQKACLSSRLLALLCNPWFTMYILNLEITLLPIYRKSSLSPPPLPSTLMGSPLGFKLRTSLPLYRLRGGGKDLQNGYGDCAECLQLPADFAPK